jgi:hypothetical protein
VRWRPVWLWKPLRCVADGAPRPAHQIEITKFYKELPDQPTCPPTFCKVLPENENDNENNNDKNDDNDNDNNNNNNNDNNNNGMM